MRMTGAVRPLLAFTLGLAGCGGFAAPSAVPPATTLAVFIDRESGFTTTDVRDVHDQIVRFNTTGELVWSDQIRFPGFLADGYVITADRICAGCYFLVRFGTKNGLERAYLTWAREASEDHPATLLDVEVVDGRLVVTDTAVTVPTDVP
jgi:hypothetical protein